MKGKGVADLYWVDPCDSDSTVTSDSLARNPLKSPGTSSRALDAASASVIGSEFKLRGCTSGLARLPHLGLSDRHKTAIEKIVAGSSSAWSPDPALHGQYPRVRHDGASGTTEPPATHRRDAVTSKTVAVDRADPQSQPHRGKMATISEAAAAQRLLEEADTVSLVMAFTTKHSDGHGTAYATPDIAAAATVPSRILAVHSRKPPLHAPISGDHRFVSIPEMRVAQAGLDVSALPDRATCGSGSRQPSAQDDDDVTPFEPEWEAHAEGRTSSHDAAAADNRRSTGAAGAVAGRVACVPPSNEPRGLLTVLRDEVTPSEQNRGPGPAAYRKLKIRAASTLAELVSFEDAASAIPDTGAVDIQTVQ